MQFEIGKAYASSCHNGLADGHEAPLVSNNNHNKSNNVYKNGNNSAYDVDNSESNNTYEW